MVLKKTDLVLNEELSYILADLEGFWKRRGFNQYSKYLSTKYLNEKGYNVGEEEIYVFEHEDKIVAIFSFMTYIFDVVEVRDFYILEQFEPKSYLPKMIDDIVNLCEFRKIRKATVYSRKEYTDLFFVKEFKKEGLLKNHFIDGEDVVLVSKFLTKPSNR